MTDREKELQDISEDRARVDKRNQAATNYLTFHVAKYGQGITAKELSEKDFPDPVWIVDSIIPEGLSLLFAKGKLGKSYLALQIAAAVAEGEKVLGEFACAKRKVLFIGLEDNERRFKDRIGQIGAEPSDNLRIQTDWAHGAEGLQALAYLFEGYPEVKFVIIDTLGRMIAGTDFNDYGSTVQLLGKLQKDAIDNHASVLVIHHAVKGHGSEDFIERALGSAGIGNSADCLMYLDRKRGQADAYLYGTGREFAEWEIALRARGDNSGGYNLLGIGSEYRRSAERQQIIKLLELEDAATSAKDIGAMLEKSYSTVRWMLAEMVKDGEIERAGRGTYRLKGGQK